MKQRKREGDNRLETKAKHSSSLVEEREQGHGHVWTMACYV